MKRYVVVGLTLLAGCATYAADDVPEGAWIQAQAGERGTRFEFRNNRTPQSAAVCVAQVLEQLTTIPASTREVGRGRWEVTMAPSGSAGPLASARTVPIQGGSLIRLWVTPAHRQPDMLASKIRESC